MEYRPPLPIWSVADSIDEFRVASTDTERKKERMVVYASLPVLVQLREHPDTVEARERGLDLIASSGLGLCGATVLLELSRGLPSIPTSEQWVRGACLSIVKHPTAAMFLPLVADLPGFSATAGWVYGAWRRGRDTGGELEAAMLDHSFWMVRLAAAESIWDPAERAAALSGFWQAVAQSGLPIDARRRFWNDEDSVQPRKTAALPSLTSGLTSTCADMRAWAALSLGQSPPAQRDKPRLILSEEDRALLVAAELHSLRTAVKTLRAIALELDMPPNEVDDMVHEMNELVDALAHKKDAGAGVTS